MSVSSVHSGYQLIQKAQSIAEEAASDIATPQNSNYLEFNQIKTDNLPEPKQKASEPIETSLTKLQQAQTYNQAGANLIQRSNDIIGTILDTHV